MRALWVALCKLSESGPWADAGRGRDRTPGVHGRCLGSPGVLSKSAVWPEVNSPLTFSMMWEDRTHPRPLVKNARSVIVTNHGLIIGRSFILDTFNVPLLQTMCSTIALTRGLCCLVLN